MTLGERVLKRRKELKMSQDELAKKIGYSTRSSITLIENNQRDLPRAKVILLAEALHTTPSYIMGWEDEDGNEVTETQPYEVLKRELGISDFTPEEKQQIINYIKFIISQREK